MERAVLVPVPSLVAVENVPSWLGSVDAARVAYQRFIADSETLSAEQIVAFRSDASLVAKNVMKALSSVAPLWDQLQVELPKLNWAQIAALPELVLAVHYAVHQIDRSAPRVLGQLINRASSLRATFLPLARGLAGKGLLPLADVQRIEAGRGNLDTATDCVDLAALFRAHFETLSGRAPITEDDLLALHQVGTTLVAILTPDRSRKPELPQTVAAVAHRDRVYSLLCAHYDLLRRAAAYQWLDDAEQYVPQLDQPT